MFDDVNSSSWNAWHSKEDFKGMCPNKKFAVTGLKKVLCSVTEDENIYLKDGKFKFIRRIQN